MKIIGKLFYACYSYLDKIGPDVFIYSLKTCYTIKNLKICTSFRASSQLHFMYWRNFWFAMTSTYFSTKFAVKTFAISWLYDISFTLRIKIKAIWLASYQWIIYVLSITVSMVNLGWMWVKCLAIYIINWTGLICTKLSDIM